MRTARVAMQHGIHRPPSRPSASPALRRARRWALTLATALLSAAALADGMPEATPAPSSAPRLHSARAASAGGSSTSASGVRLGELAPNAPASRTVQRGDTLLGLAGLYLKRPWRWSELWDLGPNERTPTLLVGQELVLSKEGGRARLSLRNEVPDATVDPDLPPSDLPQVRLGPHTRVAALRDNGLPTLQPHLIEPFLDEPIIVSADELSRAPQIVAAREGRVLLSRGDLAYALGRGGQPLALPAGRGTPRFGVFRNAEPLKDPVTGEVLGYEAQFLGRADLIRGESSVPVAGSDKPGPAVPATLDIVAARQEMRAGDRLVPEGPRTSRTYTPRAPAMPVDARVVSVYGSAVAMVGQSQVIAINKGTADGVQSGHMLAVLSDGRAALDRLDANGPAPIKLPDERNGLVMVFRTFDRLSYALVLDIADGVRVGDRLVNPR